MSDYEDLNQIIDEQRRKILELEEKVKLLSLRMDKLESNTTETIDDLLNGGRIIRS